MDFSKLYLHFIFDLAVEGLESNSRPRRKENEKVECKLYFFKVYFSKLYFSNCNFQTVFFKMDFSKVYFFKLYLHFIFGLAVQGLESNSHPMRKENEEIRMQTVFFLTVISKLYFSNCICTLYSVWPSRD